MALQRVLTSLYMKDGTPAVQLDVRRASGENTIRVIEAVKARATLGEIADRLRAAWGEHRELITV